jgi:integrase
VLLAIDAWAAIAAVSEGHGFRPVKRGDHVSGDGVSEKIIWQLLRPYASAVGAAGIAPHDLRRTTAKLCRAAGGELEQIQMLLGHFAGSDKASGTSGRSRIWFTRPTTRSS